MRLLASVALALLLAGCAAPSASVAPAQAADPPVTATPIVDANASLANVSHTHDLWAGRERAPLLDGDYEVPPDEAAFWAYATAYYVHEPSLGGAFVEPKEPSLVFEGTGRLDVIASWTSPTVTGLRAWWRSPESQAIHGPVKLENGKAAAIDVTAEMCDMAHAKRSRWAFILAADGTPAAAVGSFHVHVDMVKTRDVPLLPAHPDAWKGASALRILDADGETPAGPVGVAQDAQHPLDAPAGTLRATKDVPMDATFLDVVATLHATTPDAPVFTPRLEYTTAADVPFEMRSMAPKPGADAKTWTWRIPVKMEQTDSPYAKESGWAFRVVAEGPVPSGLPPPCGDACADAGVSYHLVVDVLKEVGT